MEKISFFDQNRKNKRRSYLLIFSVFAVLILLGYVFARIFSPDATFIILIISIIFSTAYTAGTYYYSDRIALAAVGAVPAEGEEYRRLRNRVEGLALAAGLPQPKVYVMHSPENKRLRNRKRPKTRSNMRNRRRTTTTHRTGTRGSPRP